jgi:hypothetical protein
VCERHLHHFARVGDALCGPVGVAICPQCHTVSELTATSLRSPVQRHEAIARRLHR